jgi:hypothetical protein
MYAVAFIVAISSAFASQLHVDATDYFISNDEECVAIPDQACGGTGNICLIIISGGSYVVYDNETIFGNCSDAERRPD